MTPNKKITVIGEILVEIMADTEGQGFLAPIKLTGPFPSGAPAIFIDQVAKLKQPCAIVSAVGNDDFGRVNLDRLTHDGVDVSAVAIDEDLPTGTAFVRYRADGNRDFVFNIVHSACGQLTLNASANAVLTSTDHLHIMGSSLSSPEFIALNLETAKQVKARGGTLSFDPNARKELLDRPGMRVAMDEILSLTDLFLPSGDELQMLTSAKDDKAAISQLLASGITAIVHKQGTRGARYVDASSDVFQPAFPVTEIDPTGAGDCFGGTFTALWLQGLEAKDALTLACAAGAMGVTKRGPMEGTSDLLALNDFLKANT